MTRFPSGFDIQTVADVPDDYKDRVTTIRKDGSPPVFPIVNGNGASNPGRSPVQVELVQISVVPSALYPDLVQPRSTIHQPIIHDATNGSGSLGTSPATELETPLSSNSINTICQRRQDAESRNCHSRLK